MKFAPTRPVTHIGCFIREYQKRKPTMITHNNLFQPINANYIVMGILFFIKSFLCLFYTSKEHNAPLTILVPGKSHSGVKLCAYNTLMCTMLHLVALRSLFFKYPLNPECSWIINELINSRAAQQILQYDSHNWWEWSFVHDNFYFYWKTYSNYNDVTFVGVCTKQTCFWTPEDQGPKDSF